MYLQCGKVETRKSVYIWKSLFKEACMRSILSRIFIADTLGFFEAPVPSRSFHSVHHIYPFSHKIHRRTNCVSRIMDPKPRASYISKIRLERLPSA